MDAVANFAKFAFYHLPVIRALSVAIRRPESGFGMQSMRVFCCRFAAYAAKVAGTTQFPLAQGRLGAGP
jgi:hypothetical protein